MCGIAGYLYSDPRRPASADLALRMARALNHRGPDHQAAYADGPCGLGHARLSIIDLSPEAHQPMVSTDGDVVIVLNGEIYNFKEQAAALRRAGVTFRTRSDTEVALELYRAHGLDFLADLRGMFALAIWDRRQQRLILARDRVGQKPLFYYEGPNGVSFASEASALTLDPDFTAGVDLQGMHYYLGLGYVPHHASIFAGVRKVAPGSVAIWEKGTRREQRYWRQDFTDTDPRPAREIVRDLRQRLEDAVTMRMVSDVPLGAFLSGGIDSSAIVAMMARASSKPVKTFSIGFDEADFSELHFARRVARRYNTDHHEEVVRPDAAELLPALMRQYGEPFADPSAIPTYYLSRMTRQHVTVALSGDGGDEAFGGYTRYAHEKGARLYKAIPHAIGGPFAEAVRKRLPGAKAGMLGEAAMTVRTHAARVQMADLERYVCQFGQFPTALLRQSYTPKLRAAGQRDAEHLFQSIVDESTTSNAVDRLLDIDVHTYLTDDIFVKVDIASMAHSLEVRSPFVDHHVMELAARIPTSLKLRGFRGKRVLRLAVGDLLPASIVHRRKRGFGIPHARWLRGDLRSMARDTLLSTRSIGRGYFERAAVTQLLDEHDAGIINHGLRVWNLLCLELWHRHYIDDSAQSQAA